MGPPKQSLATRKRTAAQDHQPAPPSDVEIMPNPTVSVTPASSATPPSASTPAVIAAIPMVHPSTPREPHPVAYGTLNSKDPAFFIEATVLQLKTILATAPPNLKPTLPSSATKAVVLNHIFRLRQTEALASHRPTPTHQEQLHKLMSLSTQDIIQLSQKDPSTLQRMMHSALVADPTLTPRNFSLSDPGALATTAVSWQFLSYKRAHALKDVQYTPRQQPASSAPPQHRPPRPSSSSNDPPDRRVQFQDEPQLIDDPAPVDFPFPTRSHRPAHNVDVLASLHSAPDPGDDSDGSSDDSDDDYTPRRKKTRSTDTYVDPQGFTYGAAAAIKKLLRAYPGKNYSSNSLNVRETLGPRILCNWIASGIDIPTFLFHFRWKRITAANPTQTEMEAHTLGRIIHLEMLTCSSPKQALDTRPGLEVALRRLYAILFVEEGMNSGTYHEKGVAWSNVEFILESHPNSSVMCDDISEEVARRIGIQKKRQTAVKAMETTRAAQRQRSYRPEGGRNTPPPPARKPFYRR